MEDFCGKTLGRYHIIEKLGEGGMASVYKAFDTNIECDVAVKVIRLDLLHPASAERALKRFKREAKETAQLLHPNIIRIMDYGEYDGTPYMVMPFVPGGTLKERLYKTNSPMDYQEAARLLIPIARALEFAHRNGIVHRDVKPANILITGDGQPMLTDFGVAKILENDRRTTELTGAGIAIGTPEYMAPEQWLGKELDCRADIYSLGVVFYEMITGRTPFQADTVPAVMLMVLRDPLPQPREFVKGIPEEVEKVIITALSREPEARFTSMEEFANVLVALGQVRVANNLSDQENESKKKEKLFSARKPDQYSSDSDTQIARDDDVMARRTGDKSKLNKIPKKYIYFGIGVLLLFLLIAAKIISGFFPGIKQDGSITGQQLFSHLGDGEPKMNNSNSNETKNNSEQNSNGYESNDTKLKKICGVDPISKILSDYTISYFNEFSDGMRDIEGWGADISISDGILFNVGKGSWKAAGRNEKHIKTGKAYLLRFRNQEPAFYHIYIEQEGYGKPSHRVWGFFYSKGYLYPEAYYGASFTRSNVDWRKDNLYDSSDWLCSLITIKDTSFTTQIWNPSSPDQTLIAKEEMGKEWNDFNGSSYFAAEDGVLEVDSYVELSAKED